MWCSSGLFLSFVLLGIVHSSLIEVSGDGQITAQERLSTQVSCSSVSPRPNTSCWGKLGDRTYLMYFPLLYDPEVASPLILSFHGRGKDSENQAELTGFSTPEVNNRSIAVYPHGVSHQWQGDPQATTDDVSFVTDLLSSLTTTYNIDANQIYATGKSNGGGFVGLLACDAVLSSTIAAFAAASGAFYANNTQEPTYPKVVLPPCNPSNSKRPIPFLETHGISDCTIKYLGGPDKPPKGTNTPRGITSPVLDVVQFWANQSGCDAKPQTEILCNNITKFSWSCGGVDDNVVHYQIPDIGHDWPSLELNPDCPNPPSTDTCGGKCVTCIDGSQIILDWLYSHPLNEGSSMGETPVMPDLEL